MIQKKKRPQGESEAKRAALEDEEMEDDEQEIKGSDNESLGDEDDEELEDDDEEDEYDEEDVSLISLNNYTLITDSEIC